VIGKAVIGKAVIGKAVIGQAALAVGAFVVMEPVSYAAHRWVMHESGWGLHASHHRDVADAGCSVEANDWYPVMFAGATVTAMALGRRSVRGAAVMAIATGVTAYGAAYGFVHDVYIHRRFGRLPEMRPLEWLKDAHALHHRSGGEPFGMLAPIVPRALRDRAQADERSPSAA
jgi:beta-carotene 3-hydroxylase